MRLSRETRDMVKRTVDSPHNAGRVTIRGDSIIICSRCHGFMNPEMEVEPFLLCQMCGEVLYDPGIPKPEARLAPSKRGRPPLQRAV
jgi:hypothetical protein